MSTDREPVPGRFVALPAEGRPPEPDPSITAVERDGRWWPLGTAADVAWIQAGTTIDFTVTSAIPPVFEAYATVLIPEHPDQPRHCAALLSLLRSHTADDAWWLGYLETGVDDIVFPQAPRVRMYSDWPYVLVLAGPEQAASWRRWGPSYYVMHLPLPTLMFPTDRSWLCSTLWDDGWTCIGGSAALVDALLSSPELGPLARRVQPGESATPPGHETW